MNCVVCGYEGNWNNTHAHLAEIHPELVELIEEGDRFFYDVHCPLCSWNFRNEVNPRGRDADFLKTYEREVRLVATDLLLYHLAEEHEKEFLGSDGEIAEEIGNGAG